MARGTGAQMAARARPRTTAGSGPSPADPTCATQRRFAAWERAAITAAFANGASADEIAERFACSATTVRKIVVSEGGTLRRRRFTAEQRAEIAAAYAAGETMEAIAERLGCSYNGVRKVVLASGVPTRSRGRPRSPALDPATKAEIVREYEQERLNSNEIADRHHVDWYRVKEVLAEAGVELRHYQYRQPIPLGDDDRAAIAAAYAAGAKMRDLERRYRRGTPTVRAAIVEHGVPIRRGGT